MTRTPTSQIGDQCVTFPPGESPTKGTDDQLFCGLITTWPVTTYNQPYVHSSADIAMTAVMVYSTMRRVVV